jgi:hypothetical protein
MGAPSAARTRARGRRIRHAEGRTATRHRGRPAASGLLVAVRAFRSASRARRLGAVAVHDGAAAQALGVLV